jgi:Tol biopolymer transport system component
MDVNKSNEPVDPSVTPIQNSTTKHPVKNQIRSFILIIGVVTLILVGILASKYYFLNTKKSPYTNQQAINQITSITSPNISNLSSFENNVLVTNKGKLQLINLLTGKRRDFVEGKLISSGYLYHYNGIFSPDKKWILFYKDHNIWRTSADGTDIKQLSTQGTPRTNVYWNIEIGNVKWSPDGQKIFYVVKVDNTGSGATNPHQVPPGTQEGLWVIDSEGSNQKYIPQVKSPIEWMPDSKRIVFVDNNTYKYTSPTKSYNILTREIKTLLPNTAIKNLYWSKKGDKGLYTDSRYEDSYLIDNNFQQIDVLSRQTNIQYQDKDAIQFKEAHTISPDGKHAIITELIRPNGGLTGELDANLNVYLWNTNSKEKVKLPIKVSLHTKPFWSRDSQKIVYVKQYPETLYGNENGYLSLTGDLYYYDLATKKQTQVTTSKDIEPFNIEF